MIQLTIKYGTPLGQTRETTINVRPGISLYELDYKIRAKLANLHPNWTGLQVNQSELKLLAAKVAE